MPSADGIALARVLLSATDGGRPRAGHRRSRRPPCIRSPAVSCRAPARCCIRARPASRAHGHRRARQARAARLRGSSALKGEPHVGHRVAWSRPVDLWRVKRAARAYGVTVNDVLVAALAGALRTTLATEEPPARARALQPAPARRAAARGPRQPLRPRPARAPGRRPGPDRPPVGRRRSHGRDQGLGRGRDRLRHPRRDGPCAGRGRGASRRLLLRQGLVGADQRPRAAQGRRARRARRVGRARVGSVLGTDAA